MKIKLAILENDENYLNRIVNIFGTRYADKFQIYSFTDFEVALETIVIAKIDVFISNTNFNIDVTKLPKRCGFAYFVDSPDVDMYKNQYAICKFQKVELIYKQILSIYSENSENMVGMKLADENCKIIAFCSAAGGVGSSTMAAACALNFASIGKKVIYLNIEKIGCTDLFFSGEGQFDLSDIIFALKSKKANLSLKIESCVKQDPRGVCFFSEPKIALDKLELNKDDILRLMSILKLSGTYDYIILDLDASIERDNLEIFKQLYNIVLVNDGSEISNEKTIKFIEAISVIDSNYDYKLYDRICLLYNKFSNKTNKILENIDIRSLGGVPRYEHAYTSQVLKQISSMNIFSEIL